MRSVRVRGQAGPAQVAPREKRICSPKRGRVRCDWDLTHLDRCWVWRGRWRVGRREAENGPSEWAVERAQRRRVATGALAEIGGIEGGQLMRHGDERLGSGVDLHTWHTWQEDGESG